MIVYEEAIGSILDQLPEVTDASDNVFKVRYDWGSKDVLNKFLSLPESQSKYPLIWLIPGSAKGENGKNAIQCSPRLVIATRSDKTDEFNPFIYKTDFKLILNPIAENVLTAFERSGITSYTKYEIERISNYSQNRKEGITVDIWNAVVLDIELEIRSDRCLKQIKF